MLDFHGVSKSPMNRSASKQLYSFPKADRFDKSRQSPCNNSFYETKISAFGHRTTSFGYGNKINLANKEKVPPPGQYEKDSEFAKNIKRRRGYSFGQEDKRNLINADQIVKIPGPGKYNPNPEKIHYKNLSFTMRQKYEDPLTKHQNPLGPGQYSTISGLNRQGKYFVSKFSSSGCPKIGKNKRFQEITFLSPGPGNYSDHKVTETNKTGTYFYSNFKTIKANSFCHSPRKSLAEKSQAPGPGAYTFFSEFPSKQFRL